MSYHASLPYGEIGTSSPTFYAPAGDGTVCRNYFDKDKGCKNKRCRFLHGSISPVFHASPLKGKMEGGTKSTSETPTEEKKKPAKSLEELKQIVCINFQEKGCKRGNKCRYQHILPEEMKDGTRGDGTSFKGVVSLSTPPPPPPALTSTRPLPSDHVLPTAKYTYPQASSPPTVSTASLDSPSFNPYRSLSPFVNTSLAPGSPSNTRLVRSPNSPKSKGRPLGESLSSLSSTSSSSSFGATFASSSYSSFINPNLFQQGTGSFGGSNNTGTPADMLPRSFNSDFTSLQRSFVAPSETSIFGGGNDTAPSSKLPGGPGVVSNDSSRKTTTTPAGVDLLPGNFLDTLINCAGIDDL